MEIFIFEHSFKETIVKSKDRDRSSILYFVRDRP